MVTVASCPQLFCKTKQKLTAQFYKLDFSQENLEQQVVGRGEKLTHNICKAVPRNLKLSVYILFTFTERALLTFLKLLLENQICLNHDLTSVALMIDIHNKLFLIALYQDFKWFNLLNVVVKKLCGLRSQSLMLKRTNVGLSWTNTLINDQSLNLVHINDCPF